MSLLESKYIVADIETKFGIVEVAICFNPAITHSQVAEGLGVKVVHGAGFFKIAHSPKPTVIVSGESTSLGIKSRLKDAINIHQALGIPF